MVTDYDNMVRWNVTSPCRYTHVRLHTMGYVSSIRTLRYNLRWRTPIPCRYTKVSLCSLRHLSSIMRPEVPTGRRYSVVWYRRYSVISARVRPKDPNYPYSGETPE